MKLKMSSESHRLKPCDFGISNKKYKYKSYLSLLKKSIGGRKDLLPELRNYLLYLVKYFSEPSSRSRYSKLIRDINTSDFPLNEIKKDFGELLSVLHMINSKRVSRRFDLDKDTIHIFFPLSVNEPFIDFLFIRKDGTTLDVSCKSGKCNTNTVKSSDIIGIIDNDKKLRKKWGDTDESNALVILSDHNVMNGPVYLAHFIGVEGVDDFFVKHYIDNSKNCGKSWKYDENIYGDFVYSHELNKRGKDWCFGDIRYNLEKIICSMSTGDDPELNFTEMFSDTISDNVQYVNLINIKNNVPIFKMEFAGEYTAVLRSKNGYDRAKDKLGIQILDIT